MSGNPKLVGSNIVDCIPQTGECPNHCSECFYNGGRFFRTLDEPLFPTEEEVKGKIVRVNTGNDSNNNRKLVVESTEKYVYRFFNTAIPKLDFPAPVVLTINPQYNDKAVFVDPVPLNLMFVRVRVGIWDTGIAREAVEHYVKRGVPVVFTFMRYYDRALIPAGARESYEWRQHITNAYLCPKSEAIVQFMRYFGGTGARMCGMPWSSYCVDCGHCEEFYWRTLRRISGGF